MLGLAAAAPVGWRLRFRPSEQVTAWRRGAQGERRTARLLDRLVRDGLAWHNRYRLDRTLDTVRWEAQQISRLLGTRAVALLCVHGAQVQRGGLEAQGVAIVPAHLLRGALGYDRVLSDADVALLATTARAWLRPAARAPPASMADVECLLELAATSPTSTTECPTTVSGRTESRPPGPRPRSR
jgi:hypothetical protein